MMKKMSILIVEDDIKECKKFEAVLCDNPQFRLIGMTDSSYEAVKLYEKHQPDIVILDLELHHGEGSGIQFLQEKHALKLNCLPFIFLTTNNTAELVLGMARKYGITWTFSKSQRDYSVDLPLNMALQLSSVDVDEVIIDSATQVLDPEESKKQIVSIIEKELNELGVPRTLTGRKYIIEAIYFMIEQDLFDSQVAQEVVMKHLITFFNKERTALLRTIQTAINNTWKRVPPEVLLSKYTDRINYKTGYPRANEFLRFYAYKIGSQL
jgi:DNA-binding NarL/FixJ family response regulator